MSDLSGYDAWKTASPEDCDEEAIDDGEPGVECICCGGVHFERDLEAGLCGECCALADLAIDEAEAERWREPVDAREAA